MFVFGMPVAVAVAALHYGGPVETDTLRILDRAALVSAIDETQLDLRQRSFGLTVQAHASSVGNGCATAVASQVQGQSNWTRLLRWDQTAWTGTLDDGRVTVAFYEHDGRLPSDRVTFSPTDAAAFRATIQRVAEACRTDRTREERVMVGDYPSWRSCYFAQMPALELTEMLHIAAPAEKPRATMSVYARETPEAELHLLFDGDSERAEVSFTIAGQDLRRMRISGAAFAVDGVTVAPQHSLAFYGDTRLRIRMDPFRALQPAVVAAEPAYFNRLTTSGVATLTLLNAAGEGIGALTFDVGPALAKAREALAASPWTCDTSTPAPTPAAQWQLAE